MWEDDYIPSLTLLPGTLAELGATVKAEGVSLETDVDEECLSASFILDSALNILDTLEDTNVFLFFHDLSGIARKVTSVLAATHTWQETWFINQVECILQPIHSCMSAFAPKKACETLRAVKKVLGEIRELFWDEHDCLGLLPVLFEHLGEFQPGSRLDSLEGLHDLLWDEGQHLTWLANHSLTEERIGRQNVFAQLIAIRKELNDVLTNEDFLVEMQELFEKLDTLQIISFRQDDFGD